MLSKFFSNKRNLWITGAVISLLAVSGFYAFQNAQADAELADAPPMQTAKFGREIWFSTPAGQVP